MFNNICFGFHTPQEAEKASELVLVDIAKSAAKAAEITAGDSVYIIIDEEPDALDDNTPYGDVETISQLTAKREANSVFGTRNLWATPPYKNTYKKVPIGFAEILIDGELWPDVDLKKLQNLHNESLATFKGSNKSLDLKYAKHNKDSMGEKICELWLPIQSLRLRRDPYISKVEKKTSSSDSGTTVAPATSDEEDPAEEQTQLPDDSTKEAKRTTRRTSIGKVKESKKGNK